MPGLRQVVLDCTDAGSLAEFYRRLLDLLYRPGDEPPEPGRVDERGRDWLVLRNTGRRPPAGLPAGRSPAGSEEPLRVYADLAGHPFCIFVA